MKNQRFGLVMMVILVAILIQLCDCSSVLAVPDEYVSVGYTEFQQANGGQGTFKLLKKSNGQLAGSVVHQFRVLIEKSTFGHDKWDWIEIAGDILDGRAEGDRFTITVHYYPYKEPRFFNGGNYVYEGTMSPGGVVVGDQYNVFTPESRVKWSTTRALRWEDVKKPATPPTPKKDVLAPPGPNPAPWVNYSGSWEIQTSTPGKTLILTSSQTGNSVFGLYKLKPPTNESINGDFKGTIDSTGKVTYKWVETGSNPANGTGYLKTYPDSNMFQGWFSTEFPNAKLDAGSWTGRKIGSDAMKVSTRGTDGGFIQMFPGVPASNPPASAPDTNPKIRYVSVPGSGPVPINGPTFVEIPPNLGNPALNAAALAQNATNLQIFQTNRLYAGKWALATSTGTQFIMTLTQNGATVSGTYSPNDGKIDGTMGSDGKLSYKWSDGRGSSGTGVFFISDAVNIDGTYNRAATPNEVAGSWSGHRQN